jgi:aspartate racemase
MSGSEDARAGPIATVGLVGGMSWETSAVYYRLINEGVRERLGGFHSPPSVLYSVDSHEIDALQRSGSWTQAGELLTQAALAVERGGADFLVLCTNTMHRVSAAIEARVGIPLLHIADAAGRALRDREVVRVGLLGSRSTMEQEFIRDRLAAGGLDVRIPADGERAEIHEFIFDEVMHGVVSPDSSRRLHEIVERLAADGAQTVVVANLELDALLDDGSAAVPLLHTIRTHAEAAADLAIGATPMLERAASATSRSRY